jgi:hypothetical protein
MPLKFYELRDLLEEKFKGPDYALFASKYLSSTQESAKNFSKWVSRLLKRFGFSLRESTVSQSVPFDWKQQCIDFKAHVEYFFASFDPEYFVAADETFMKFHEAKKEKVITVKGQRRVNTGTKMDNEKMGVTLMVSCELFTGRVLKPFFVLEGTWGGKLMEEYKTRETSTVVFNDNHWMSTEAFKVFLKTLYEAFKGKRIGLIVDQFSGHRRREQQERSCDAKNTAYSPGTYFSPSGRRRGDKRPLKRESEKQVPSARKAV